MRNSSHNFEKKGEKTLKSPFIMFIDFDFLINIIKSEMENNKPGKEVQDVRALL